MFISPCVGAPGRARTVIWLMNRLELSVIALRPPIFRYDLAREITVSSFYCRTNSTKDEW